MDRKRRVRKASKDKDLLLMRKSKRSLKLSTELGDKTDLPPVVGRKNNRNVDMSYNAIYHKKQMKVIQGTYRNF